MDAVTILDLELPRGSFHLGPLTLAVARGSRTAIVGPSGSGKTTLLRCLAGFERPTRGTIHIGEHTVVDARTCLPPDRRGVGFVFQDGALWPHLSALQHLTFAAPGLGKDAARALLARGGLGHLADRKPDTISGGEAQRLGLLRALAANPRVLLLDEPLRSVDVHRRDELVLLIRSLVDERGLTMVLVTHDRDEALALADDLVVMHDGKLVERGPALTLLQQPRTAFAAAFLGAAACLPTTDRGTAIETPLGTFRRPNGTTGDLLLCVMPGDATATAATADLPAGKVLACTPAAGAFSLRVAFAGQIVQATAAAPHHAGAMVSVALQATPRLLPWSNPSVPSA
ncbi:MAG: ATP-binding cassette domain-containing protein [Planctomycetes bacterium]|nr:ATP-binding cassette domain-containing protein [Planctomycetota bacterium]